MRHTMQRRYLTRALRLVLIIGLLAACSNSDPEEVRAAILTSSDPSSDSLYVLEAVEAAENACRLEEGIELLKPNGRVSNFVLDGQLALQGPPEFRRLDGQVIGYTVEVEERHIAHRQAYSSVAHDHDIEEEDESSVGWDSPEDESASQAEEPAETVPVISFDVPMFGTQGVLLDGCNGEALTTVIPDEHLVNYLVGEAILAEFGFTVHQEALERTSKLKDWRECMQKEGFDVRSPFNILKRHDYLPEQIAPVDEQCRQETGFVGAYLRQVDGLLKDVPSSALAALEEFDMIASEIRLAE